MKLLLALSGSLIALVHSQAPTDTGRPVPPVKLTMEAQPKREIFLSPPAADQPNQQGNQGRPPRPQLLGDEVETQRPGPPPAQFMGDQQGRNMQEPRWRQSGSRPEFENEERGPRGDHRKPPRDRPEGETRERQMIPMPEGPEGQHKPIHSIPLPLLDEPAADEQPRQHHGERRKDGHHKGRRDEREREGMKPIVAGEARERGPEYNMRMDEDDDEDFEENHHKRRREGHGWVFWGFMVGGVMASIALVKGCIRKRRHCRARHAEMQRQRQMMQPQMEPTMMHQMAAPVQRDPNEISRMVEYHLNEARRLEELARRQVQEQNIMVGRPVGQVMHYPYGEHIAIQQRM